VDFHSRITHLCTWLLCRPRVIPLCATATPFLRRSLPPISHLVLSTISWCPASVEKELVVLEERAKLLVVYTRAHVDLKPLNVLASLFLVLQKARGSEILSCPVIFLSLHRFLKVLME
jgi:hypothetical protein